jgi:(1->4)-alpha-D-glucan 1-alpha-D-glucosylmutase
MTEHSTDRPRWFPVSTYRLQLHRGFRFPDAQAVVPYLATLGVTACYSSPQLRARPGSTHGYDITNHNELNPELGTEAEYDGFTRALAGQDLVQLVDFVPNHMGIDPEANPWWQDVLENGACSAHAHFFDVDWDPVKPELKGKVLLPILGDQYGNVLERGELRLWYADGALHLDYFDHQLPINPRQATKLYRHGLDQLKAELGEQDPHLREFLSIISALQNMPAYTESDPERIAERKREKEVSRERLGRLLDQSERIRRHIEDAIIAFNGKPGRPESFDLLHDLLEAQAYRLAYWRVAAHEINYRRFFDINDLAGLRMEDPEVFSTTHALLQRLLAEQRIAGVRIDHPDGLYDPARYFEMLQDLARAAWRGEGAPDVEPSGGRSLYLLAEKILSASETLPTSWAIHGTTGYNFLNGLNGLFISQPAARPLRKLYSRVTGRNEPFAEVVYASKKLIMETSMSSELNVLSHALDQLAESNRRSRDFTLESLRRVLQEFVACFPVYRTYVNASGWTPSDRQVIETAVLTARRRNPAMESSIFDFLREVLLPRVPGDRAPEGGHAAGDRRRGYPPADEEDYRRRLHFSMRVQQYTSPVQAKGIEDTAFYRYNLLVSMNEVGGEPSRFGRTPEEFHQMNAARLDRWPLEMLSTATHDTKLGEDVRARINALSELVDEWRRELSRWVRTNGSNRTMAQGDWAPDRNDEYRFYQVLLGAWPAELTLEPGTDPVPAAPPALVARMREYMIKAIKEAKVHTSWVTDNKAYEGGVTAFVERSLTGPTASRFVAAFLPFQRRIALLGVLNSLSALLLKIASPGVPDFYQGTELWDLSLVDPDTRRPVDFERRREWLAELEPALAPPSGGPDDAAAVATRADRIADLLAHWRDGRIKLFLTACGLRFRRDHRELFLAGDYLPLEVDVTVPADLVVFARRRQEQTVIAVAPRLVASVTSSDRPFPVGGESWKTSRILLPADLHARTFRNVFTGEEVRAVSHREQAWIFAGEALRTCPVAMLEGVE